jgi:CBS domain-containing protein
MSEREDEAYFDTAEPELNDVSAAALDATVATLSPAEPLCLRATATVHEAVQAMLARRQAGVLVVDSEGRLAGIFTERDVLTRVVGRELDPRRTVLREVMTPSPEALTLEDRVAHAVYCMSVAGYRTVPLVDPEGRPVGVITASDVLRWLADLFPETVLNMRPGDRIKRAGEIDMG